jgi:hypothetical protein
MSASHAGVNSRTAARQHLRSSPVARCKPLFAKTVERNEPCHLLTFFEARGADEGQVPSVNEALTIRKIGTTYARHTSPRARDPRLGMRPQGVNR